MINDTINQTFTSFLLRKNQKIVIFVAVSRGRRRIRGPKVPLFVDLSGCLNGIYTLQKRKMDTQKIQSIVDRFTEGTDLFLVEVKVSPMNEVEVVIDSDNFVTIDTCAELSKAIEAEFDREVEDFELSVMSAGIGQPLKLQRQYQKATGHPVEVLMKDGMKYAGVLEKAAADTVTVVWEEKQLVEGKKRRQMVEVRKDIALDETKTVKRQLDFK